MSEIRSSRFSPRQVPPERLEALFVGAERRRMVRRLVDDLFATRDAGGGRYEVIVAPRGAGKSHLLGLVSHRLKTDPRRGALMVAELTEEEHPSGLVDLLARMLLSLPHEEGLPAPADQVRMLRGTVRGEQPAAAEGMLRARVGERPLILLAENLDRVFSAIGTQGQQRLRALLHERRWSLIGTSCTWSDAFKNPKVPFYNGLIRNPLPEFSDEDAILMAVNLARVHGDEDLARQLQAPHGRARLRAMRLLIGGNPRAMALLFPFLRAGRMNDLEGTFLDLSEELTPYFQDQMSRLPDGQRPYVEHLAGSWTPVSVRELAELTFSTQQTASGQLRYLKQNGLVIASPVGRESFYEIAEPLHRLALCMKRPDRAPAALARMAAAWMERGELEQRWMEAGALTTLADPWFLALKLTEEPGSKYEAALVAEIERQSAAGDLLAAAAFAEREWHARHMEAVGIRLLMLRLHQGGAGAPELAEDLWGRCGPKVGPLLAFSAAEWGQTWPAELERVVLESAREAANSGTGGAAFALFVYAGTPEVERERWLPLARAFLPSLPVTSIVRCLVTLTLGGRARQLWELFDGFVWSELPWYARLWWLSGACDAGHTDEVDADELTVGLEEQPRGLVLAAVRSLQGRVEEARRILGDGVEVTLPFPQGDPGVMSMVLMRTLGPLALPLLINLATLHRDQFAPQVAAGVLLLEEERVAEAVPHLTLATELQPGLASLHELRAQALAMLNRWPEAAEAAGRASAELGAFVSALARLLDEPAGSIPDLAPVNSFERFGGGFLGALLSLTSRDSARWRPLLARLIASGGAWAATFETVIVGVFIVEWPSPEAARWILPLAEDLIPDSTTLSVLRALHALPDDARPFQQLPAPARQLARLLTSDTRKGTPIPIPPEPDVSH